MTDASPEDKQRAHFERAKKAVLAHAVEQGGQCSMAALHEFSEQKYFIAHQRFSQLLEECVAEDLVEVAEFEVTLTERGKAFAGE